MSTLFSSDLKAPPGVAVTGGTGFIGGHLLTALLARGLDVRALTRGKVTHQNRRIHWIQGSLDSDQALDELVRDATHLIHLAGRVSGNKRADFMQSNVQGTRRLVERCSALNQSLRLLLVSSIAAREPQLSHYAHSKRMAEECLGDAHSGVQWTVFRPPAVYGPGDTEVRPLLQGASKGFFIAPRRLEHRLSLIHVKDLVAAIMAWFDAEDTGGQVLEVSDAAPNGYSWQEIIEVLSRHFGREVRAVRMPKSFLVFVGGVNQGLATILGRDSMISPGKAREFSHPNWVADSLPAQRLLRWQPRISLAEGLHQLD